METIFKELNSKVDIWISNGEKLGLYSLKYIADLVSEGKVSHVLLFQADAIVEESLQILLVPNLIISNPDNSVIEKSLSETSVIAIGLNLLNEEFQKIKQSKNKSVVFIPTLGIFKSSLQKNFKNIRFEEVSFSDYIKSTIISEISPSDELLSDKSTFVNRSIEIEKITNILHSESYKGIKILGMPGIGKKSIISELKQRRIIGRNCFEFYLQDELDNLNDIFSSLSAKLGLKIDIDQQRNVNLNERSSQSKLKQVIDVFDGLPNAVIIFYNINYLLDSGGRMNSGILEFFKRLLLRSSYKGNKILFVSDANFQLDFESEAIVTDVTLFALDDAHTKQIMHDEYVNRGLIEFGRKLVSIDDSVLGKIVNGHPLISKLFVKASEKYGIDNLVNDSNLLKEFNEKQKVQYLLSRIEILPQEYSILQLLSLFNEPIDYSFIKKHEQEGQNQITGLIDKFLLSQIVLADASVKYYVPEIIKDLIVYKTDKSVNAANHDMIGIYYWEISEDLNKKSFEILEGYQKAFHHFSESGNLEKIRLLSLVFKGKIVTKAYTLFTKRLFDASWMLFNELYITDNLDYVGHLRKYLEAEVIINGNMYDTETKILKALSDFPGDFSLQLTYAKFLFQKGRYSEARDICNKLLNGKFPSESNKLNILHVRIIYAEGGKKEAENLARIAILALEKEVAANPNAKFPLGTLYSLLVNFKLRTMEDQKSIVKKVIRSLEDFAALDQRLYKIIESENEVSDIIIRLYEVIYRSSSPDFESYIQYLIRKGRERFVDEIIVRNAGEPFNLLDGNIAAFREKVNRNENLFYYAANKMGQLSERLFEDISNLTAYVNDLELKVDELVLIISKAKQMNIRLSVDLVRAEIELYMYKETLENIKKIVLLYENPHLRQEYFNADTSIVVYLEGETDELYIERAARLFERNHIGIRYLWIGNFDERGNTFFTGDTALNQTYNYYRSNTQMLSTKHQVVLLYDSDTSKPPSDFSYLFVRVIPENSENKFFKIGIENLLELPDTFNPEVFYSSTSKIDGYGAQSIVRKLDKMKLCKWICNELEPANQKQVLKNFKQIFDSVEQIFQHSL